MNLFDLIEMLMSYLVTDVAQERFIVFIFPR